MDKLIDIIRAKLYQAERYGSDNARIKAIHDVLWLIAKEEESERIRFEYYNQLK
jgi:hypothetical protein